MMMDSTIRCMPILCKTAIVTVIGTKIKDVLCIFILL